MSLTYEFPNNCLDLKVQVCIYVYMAIIYRKKNSVDHQHQNVFWQESESSVTFGRLKIPSAF